MKELPIFSILQSNRLDDLHSVSPYEHKRLSFKPRNDGVSGVQGQAKPSSFMGFTVFCVWKHLDADSGIM